MTQRHARAGGSGPPLHVLLLLLDPLPEGRTRVLARDDERRYDVDTLALMLIGTGHMLFAGRDGTPPEAGAVRKVVTTVIAGVLP